MDCTTIILLFKKNNQNNIVYTGFPVTSVQVLNECHVSKPARPCPMDLTAQTTRNHLTFLTESRCQLARTVLTRTACNQNHNYP